MTLKLVTITLPFKTLYLTNYHRDLTIAGQTYKTSVLIDAIEHTISASLLPDTAQINLIPIKEHHFIGGILEVSDYDLQTHQILSPVCFYGTITQTQIHDTHMTLVAHSTKNLLNTVITRTYNTHCQAQWGDNRCSINTELYKQEIQITHINDNIIGYNVLNGMVDIFYSPYISNSLGHIIPIQNLDSVNHTFQTEPFYMFKIGQSYTLYAGCKKNTTNCQAYNNTMNYLGFSA